MNQSHCKYVDTAVGGPADRNHVIDIRTWAERMPSNKTEVYCTWHRFPEVYLDHWKSDGSVTGYSGPSYADFIPFDFDGDDVNLVLVNVRKVLDDLYIKLEVECGVRVYFSGCKGFHLLLDAELFGGWTPSPSLSENLKDLAIRVMGDYEGFDQSIYDKNRLLRLPNTINEKSGLWKIPLELSEIRTCSIEEIRDLASAPRDIQFPQWGDCVLSSGLREIWQDVTSVVSKKPLRKVDNATLWQRGLHEGDGRDNTAFAIARMLRKKGIDEGNVFEILKLWDAQQSDPLGDKILEQKVKSTFRMTNSPVEKSAVLTAIELADTYRDHIEKLRQRKVLLGFPAIDVKTRGVVPGEVCTVIARSGVGKTLVAQNIILNCASDNQDMSSLFCSLEQPDSMCFERYAQMATGKAGYVIENEWENSDDSRVNITDSVIDKLGDKNFTYVLGVSVNDLNSLVDHVESRIGGPLHLLVIDYLGYIGMDGMGKNLYEQTSNVARSLKQFAKARELALVLLCQVGRAAGEDGKIPLTKSAARESGAIEESADILLGLYRPSMGEFDLSGNSADNTMAMQILKNRKGSEGDTYLFNFDSVSLRITGPGFLMRDEIPIKKTQRPQ